ncbi:MAG: hypothetical protein NTZ80_00405, partial [Patescibacteria group bacterium]|nr:hypothetical protein [Patescibacteria group bacterium]
MKTCSKCQAQLEVQDQDRDFYNKISPVFNGQKYQIPEPNFCPDCRMQRRLAFRNERSLYRRKCDATSATIISIYSPDKPYKVYQNNYWWGDAWDPMKYGREFDFNRSFTEQFAKLWIEVPMPARTSDEPTMENSEYCNEAGGLKDCYLCFEGALSERCYYSRGIIRCFDCLDCLNCCDCQASYALVECQNCAFCRYIFDCKTCDNCYFCADCSGCSNCFNSVNSRNKKYCFNNVQLTKEEYADRVQKTFGENSYPILLQNFLHYKSSQFTRPFHLINTENCSG